MSQLMHTLLVEVGRFLRPGDGAARTDGQLLECFLAHRDEAAFEALLRRHAAMVYGTCRRVLGDLPDADDAFQATFLVLVRKAASIVPRDAVGAWLHGVALRTAMDARAARLRRLAREKQVIDMPQPATRPAESWIDVLPLLDEELGRLPPRYREPVILCELEGRSRREVAGQLGLPEGTLSSRLATARKKLARALSRRGVTLSAGVIAAALAQPASASPALLVATVKAAVMGTAAPAVAALTQGVIKGMLLTKLKTGTVALLLLGALTVAGQGLRPGPGAPPTAPTIASAVRAEEAPPERPKKIDLNQFFSGGKAKGKGPVKLKHFPLRLADIGQVLPMGMMVGGHVTPSDHLYLVPKDRKASDDHYDVLAVADGFLVQVQSPPGKNPDPAVTKKAGKYRLVFEHSATCWSYVGLINEMDKGILKQIGQEIKPGRPVMMRVPVKAGQVVGKTGGSHSFDFGLIDTTVTLKGFARPEQFYQRDPWKPHTVDPFDYVEGPLKAKLLALNPRTAKPRGGKIDYDLAGRLAGNWYQEKTGGYAGLKKRLDYWVGHVTVAYHHIDPTKVVVSLGQFGDRPRQFFVKGNGPDPAKVSKASGLVKYELVWAPIGNDGRKYEDLDDSVQGVVLFQLIEDGKLKVEVFKGKTATEVKGFTRAAKVYER